MLLEIPTLYFTYTYIAIPRYSALHLVLLSTAFNFVQQHSAVAETAHSPSKHKDKHRFIISQCKHTEL